MTLPQELDITHYLRILRRRKLTFGVTFTVLFLALLSYSVYRLTMFPFQAEAVIYIEPEIPFAFNIEQYKNSLPEGGLNYENFYATQVNTIMSREITERVIKKLSSHVKGDVFKGSEPAEDLANAIYAKRKRDSKFIRIVVTRNSRKNLELITNTIAEEFISYYRENREKAFEQAFSAMNDRIKEIRQELAQYKKELGNTQKNAGVSELVMGEFSEKEGFYKSLLQKFEETKLSEKIRLNKIKLFENAKLVNLPSKQGLIIDLVKQLLFILLCSIASVFIKESVDFSIRDAHDIYGVSHFPLLGSIPKISNPDSKKGPIISHEKVYREIIKNIFLFHEDQEMKSLFVTSAQEEEGKTVITSGLGRAYASAGNKVLLVDCDFESNSLSRMFGFSEHAGLGMLLSDKHGSAGDYVTHTGEENLFILPSGGGDQGKGVLLTMAGVGRIRELGDELKREFDVVIFDSGPCYTRAESTVIAPVADMVIVVARQGWLLRSNFREILQQLSSAQVKNLGIIMNFGSLPGNMC